jgi:hypothetical protein
VVPSHDPYAGPRVQGVEFRGATRYRLLQRCFVRPPGVGPGDGWRGIVFSLSATGVGVTLPLAVERGTEVTIEPWQLQGGAALTARVVYVSRLEFVWLVGCELTRRLTDDELAVWLATATTG